MYKATQTRIQTYLNDVAGVRIVCAFIDDIDYDAMTVTTDKP